MKVIDLLNKIANGEEVPKKIRWSGVDFEYIEQETYNDYINFNNCSLFRHDNDIYKVTNMLNDEVEIIEENKKIEKIVKVLCMSDLIDMNDFVIEYLAELKYKINEIIEVINNENK